MIRIVTDSTASISIEESKILNIDIVPLYVLINDNIYKDRVDFTDDEFYTLLKKYQPTTSQPNPIDFLNIFDKYPNDEIICITVSDKLSGTFQSANIAKSMCDNKNICVINSDNISLGLKHLILEAINMRDNNFSFNDIVNNLQRVKTKIVTVGLADNFDNLKRGGRISNIKFFAANILNIKPLLMVKDGVLQAYHKKARGKQAAINILINSLNYFNYDLKTNILLGYTHNPENTKIISEKLAALNITSYDKKFYELGCVIGTHTGENAFIMSFLAI